MTEKELFPLPLTIFELYMLLDDNPSYPMDSFRRLELTGLLNHAAFETAVSLAVNRHPLFGCRVEKRLNRWYWVPTNESPEIRWIDSSNDSAKNESGFPNAQPLDIKNHAGFRVYCIESEKSTEIVLQFHHSSSDGTGEMQFVRDLVTLYAVAIGAIDSSVELPLLDNSVLLRRGQLGWSLAGYVRNYFSTSMTTWQMLFKRVAPLTVPQTDKQQVLSADLYPQIREREWTTEQTAAYAQAAKKAGVTVNDALLADFAMAIDQWRQYKKVPVPSGQLRLSVPMNLRSGQHENMPAGNVVTMVFVDVDKKRLNNRDNQIQSMHDKMSWIKNRDQKFVLDLFLKAGNALGNLFGQGLSPFLKSGRSRSTACLSNLGRVLETVPLPRDSRRCIQIGAQLLTSVSAAPPIRPGTALSLSALTYAGRLRLCLRFDSRVINTEDADYLLDKVTACLQ